MSEKRQPSRRMRAMSLIVEGKQKRRIQAREQDHRSVWFGFGLFGVVGWSIALPTVIGVGIGFWIDHRWESRFSWTLMLMFGGVVLGCLTAWKWIKEESSKSEAETPNEERTR